MEKILLRLTFSACTIIGAIALNSYSGGGFSSDLTGSPLSSSTCQNGCHNTYSLNSGSGSVSMSVPSNYYPGTTYTVSMNVSQSSPSPARYGFMAGALRDNNANGGTFTASTGSAATTISSRSYIRHNSTYNSTGAWSFSWTAPSYADTITFYYVGNAANGASGNNGDYIYTGSTTIYPIQPMTASIDTTDVSCDGVCDGAVSLSNVTGGEGGPYAYTWSNGDTTASIASLCAGTYTVTIADANGNEEVITSEVGSPAPINLTFTVVGTSCATGSGSISVQAIGGTEPYSYLWNTGDVDSSLTNVFTGLYTVTITDSNGCTVVDSSLVNSTGSGLVAVFNVQDESCGQANGSLALSMVVGNAPYSYAWSNGGTNASISGLSAGTYTVTVTDSAGCMDSFTETIADAVAEIDVNGAIINDVSCYGDSNGSITVTAAQGSQPWQFVWSTGFSGGTITGLSAGSYSVTLTDSAGCTDEATFGINEPDSIEAVVSSDSSNEGFCDGMITLNVAGGVAPYIYTWSHDASLNSNEAMGLCAGPYSVTITDANGCEKVISSSVGTVTSVSEIGSNKIRVFPNPANDILYIESTETSLERMDMLDMSGRVIRTWNGNALSLDLNGIEIGRYNLLIRSKEGFIVKAIVVGR